MKQEDKELLLKDLCVRLPYQPLCKKVDTEDDFCECNGPLGYSLRDLIDNKIIIKPYLRPMSSMTEEEAKEIAILHDIKDILSVKVTSDYIDIIVDDGVCSTETRTIWYDEIISSIEIFDWLNKYHFDYRGLIEKGLAIEAPEGMYNLTIMKCIKCGKEIPSYWYYKNDKELCGDYTYIGYCAICEDFARYTGNL